jgi:MFS family permease
MTLAVTYSSTSLLSATEEIASEFSTTTEIINITNAGVLIAMGSSSFIWGPISEIVGRRNAYNSAIGVLLLCSIGAALARDMVTFTTMRVLGGSVGTFFMVAGQTIIADVFEPVSLFWFLCSYTNENIRANTHVTYRLFAGQQLVFLW